MYIYTCIENYFQEMRVQTLDIENRNISNLFKNTT